MKRFIKYFFDKRKTKHGFLQWGFIKKGIDQCTGPKKEKILIY